MAGSDPRPFVSLLGFFSGNLRFFLSAFSAYFAAHFSNLSLSFASYCLFWSLAFCSSCHLCDVRTEDILSNFLFPFLAGFCGYSRISFNRWEWSSAVEGEESEFSGSYKLSSSEIFGSCRTIFRFTRIVSMLLPLPVLVLGWSVVISTKSGSSSSVESVYVSIELVWIFHLFFSRNLYKRRKSSNSSLLFFEYFQHSSFYSCRRLDGRPSIDRFGNVAFGISLQSVSVERLLNMGRLHFQ